MVTKSKRPEVILVVDDAPETLSLINDTLEEAGFNVLVALEGKQALIITQRIRPDLILLDAVMPAMDGFETCRALKRMPELTTVPVIFMTGLTDSGSIVKGLEAGGVDYLTKPIDAEELIARMNVHLSNARLTSIAHSALDSSGQFLFSINTEGRITWATPQTYALFAKVNMTDKWRESVLSRQLVDWLNTAPEPDQTLSVTGLEITLNVRLINASRENELLLRVTELNEVPGEELLYKALNLTTRESQVLLWVSNGKTNREIAQILQMRPRTVNKHLEQIFPKLGVENRTAAARVAIRALSQTASDCA